MKSLVLRVLAIILYALVAVCVAACAAGTPDGAGAEIQDDGRVGRDQARLSGDAPQAPSTFNPVTSWNPSNAIDLGSTYAGVVTIEYDIAFLRAYSAFAIGYADPATVIDGPGKLNLGI